MRLLLETEDRKAVREVDLLLSGKGIATDLRERGGMRTPYIAQIFVVFDAQFEDARALLYDSKHEVSIVVPEEYWQHRSRPEAYSYGPLLKPVLITLLIVVAIAALALWLRME